MSDKTVVFGPWFGEFGWEITRWNPACRYLANTKYKDWHKIMIGPAGHEAIYEYVDQYIPIKEAQRMPNMTTATFDNQKLPAKYDQLAKKLGSSIVPHTLVRAQVKFKTDPKKFVGHSIDKIKSLTNKKIIVIFPRQRSLNKHRNWGVKNWTDLAKYCIDRDFHVIAFGGIEDKPLNYDHENYTDYIGYHGDDQLDLCVSALNLAECGIAIQSGGIHLSMYACKRTAAFGVKSYHNRHLALVGKNYPKSGYEYIGYPKDTWKFPLNFVTTNVDRILSK